MSFMVPHVEFGVFYDVEDKRGEGSLVPGDLVGSTPKGDEDA